MITATVLSDRIYVAAPFAMKDKLKALAGARWDPQARQWHYPANPEVARDIYLAIPIGKTDRAFAALLDDAKAKRDAAAAAEEVPASQLPPIPFKDFEPWPHQKKGFWKAAPHDGYMLAMQTAELCVGNSSSFLVESPWIGVPSIIIGRRQHGRPLASSCFTWSRGDETPLSEVIVKAIGFRGYSNPFYFGGPVGEKIAAIIRGETA